MLWYNILNPKNWPGVTIQTGNNKIDGIYQNLLSSRHVSLAASGSMFLVASSGIKLISPSYVDTSGIRAASILSENFYKINNSGNIIPLYSGANSGVTFKLNDNNLVASNILVYDTGNNILKFPSSNPGSPLYTVPSYTENGEVVNLNNLSSFDHLVFKPEETDAADPPNVTPATITANSLIFANSGISLGPNNNLDSYKGFILTHAGSGEPAAWKPATYLREYYDTSLPLDGLEQVGVSWIRFPKRPVKFLDGKIAFYLSNRPWSPYPALSDFTQLEVEFGPFDTVQVETIGTSEIDVSIEYVKFASVDRFPLIASDPTGVIAGPHDFADMFVVTTTIDPLDDSENPQPVPVLVVNICPDQPVAINQNGYSFSVTKGGYLPMQLGSDATETLTCPDATNFTFKPSTLNNISIRPDIHTGFNMLGENIDFLIYPKSSLPYNNYSSIYTLNDNYIPQGFIPTFKVDANIPNAVSGSPTGVYFSKYLDREKTIPSGWSFDNLGKVCVNTSGSYVLASIVSGEGLLSTYADLTVSGSTYSTSLVAEDIYLKPPPSADGSSKYIANSLLTVNYDGKIVSRVPRINPVIPDAPTNIRGAIGHGNAGIGNNEYSLEWDEPENDGRSKIVKYLIQFSFNNGESWTNAQDASINDPTYIDRGLLDQTSSTIKTVAGNNVLFRVAAQNGVGIGPYSEATNLLNPNNNVPTAPISFSGSRSFDGSISSIELSWGASAQQGVGAFSGYIIEESDDYGINWYYHNSPSDNNFINTTSETIYGLESEKDYLYRISSWNTSGQGTYSFFYSSGLKISMVDPEEEEQKNDVLSTWDFGTILFTGVCNL